MSAPWLPTASDRLEAVPIVTLYLLWMGYGLHDAVRHHLRGGWMLYAGVAFALVATLWLTARRARARGATYAHASGGAELLYALGTLRVLERLELPELVRLRWAAVVSAACLVLLAAHIIMARFLTSPPPAPECPDPIHLDDAAAIDDAQQRSAARGGVLR
jgi:hypothetical protein